MKKQKADVIVIGGGASGMLAAGIAAGQGRRVFLFEGNPRLGRKLYITGKGRCNLTNDCTVEEVLKNIPHSSRFMYSSLSRFSPADVMDFFKELGVPLKTERGGRVFPVSDKATDIIDALAGFIKKAGVTTIFEKVTDVKCGFEISTAQGSYDSDSLIIATGGLSYPGTGSTGDGYAFARKLGHTVTPLTPSLVPLEISQPFCSQMSGLSLKNINLSLYNEKDRLLYCEQGEMLFTHFGVSGPLILSASAHMEPDVKHYILLDLKPALDEKKLDLRILRDFEEFKNRDFANSLTKLLARAMIPVIIELSGIPPETKVNSITKEQRLSLVRLLKNFRLDISGQRPVEEAIITSGGIKTNEINPSTMESKIAPGLYFAGEIIDVDSYTGGFNLQIAWSTGYCAGSYA